MGDFVGDLLKGLPIIGGIVDVGQDVANTAIAQENFMLQQAAFQWQKEAQETTWKREDSAVRRRAADLKAAGINPLLAAGAAAQTGSPVRVEAPQRAPVSFHSPETMMNLITQRQDIARTQEQVNLMHEQVRSQQIANESAQRDLDIAKSKGTSSKGDENRNDALYQVLNPDNDPFKALMINLLMKALGAGGDAFKDLMKAVK